MYSIITTCLPRAELVERQTGAFDELRSGAYFPFTFGLPRAELVERQTGVFDELCSGAYQKTLVDLPPRSSSNGKLKDMKLYFTKADIPHGYLCSTPIHLIYRVQNCAPVRQLKLIHQEFVQQLEVLKKLKNKTSAHYDHVRKAQFEAYDALLDSQDQSKFILANQQAAEIVISSWLDLQKMKRIVLYAVCVMGNHVHVLLRGREDADELPIGKVVRQHKTYTNKLIKSALERSENVWDDGFYDRYVRPGSFWVVLEYILQNPVAAQLVRDWKTWPNMYVDERCVR